MKNYLSKKGILTGAMIVLMTLCLVGLSHGAYAEGDTSVVDDVVIKVNSSCTLTSGGGNYADTVENNMSAEISANTITTVCNDASGYALYAIGFSGDVYTGGNNNKMLASAGADYNINTATSGSDSYWAMKLAKATASASDANLSITNSFDSYHAVPASFTQVASYSSLTTAAGASVDPTYKIYMNSTQAAGTYTGKVKYVLVHPSTMTAGTYTIAYNANGGSGSMSSTTGLYNFEEQTLPANGFTAPSGYAFAGWCTVQDNTQTPYQSTCSGDTYADQGTVPPSTATNGGTLTLYAMWKIPVTIANATYLQEVEACPNTLTTNQVYTIKDSRDETEYHAARLADDKCWLLDNLALDLTNSTILNSISSNNTNIDSNNESAILTSLKSGNRTAGDQYATGGITVWDSSSTANSYSVPKVNMASKDTVPQGDDPMASTVLAGNWKVGGYYNYCAASAGSYCYGSGTSAGTSSGNASEDICPKGWRMPTGNTSGEYQALYNNASYNNYNNYRTALHIPLSGYFHNGSVFSQGSYGRFWSSTRDSNGNMYYLYLNKSNIYPAYDDYRYRGFSVRCVLQ